MTKNRNKSDQIPGNISASVLPNSNEIQMGSLSRYLEKVLERIETHVKSDVLSVLLWEEKPIVLAFRGPTTNNKLIDMFSSPTLASVFSEYIINGVVCDDNHISSKHTLGSFKGIPDTENTNIDIPDYKHWLLAPIYQKGQILGFLFLGRNEGNEFSIPEVDLVLSFAEIISDPISNENNYAVVARIASEGEALLGVLQALTSQLELDVVLQLIADEARRLTNTRTALLLLVNGDQLKTVAISGLYSPDVYIGYEIPLNNSNTGTSILLRKPVRVQDAWNNPTVYKSDHLRVRSFISVPLIFESNAIGAIMVADKLSGELGNDDERIASMFASSAVIAVENARLYKEEQERRLEADQRRRVAEGLREILAILNSHKPLPDMLHQISRQTCQLLGCDACAISQLSSDATKLIIQASYGIPEEFLSLDYYPKGVDLVNQTIQNGKSKIFWIERA